MLDLHAEMLSVFDSGDIITPDQLRGNASSLSAALLGDGGRCGATTPPRAIDRSGEFCRSLSLWWCVLILHTENVSRNREQCDVLASALPPFESCRQ